MLESAVLRLVVLACAGVAIGCRDGTSKPPDPPVVDETAVPPDPPAPVDADPEMDARIAALGDASPPPRQDALDALSATPPEAARRLAQRVRREVVAGGDDVSLLLRALRRSGEQHPEAYAAALREELPNLRAWRPVRGTTLDLRDPLKEWLSMLHELGGDRPSRPPLVAYLFSREPRDVHLRTAVLGIVVRTEDVDALPAVRTAFLDLASPAEVVQAAAHPLLALGTDEDRHAVADRARRALAAAPDDSAAADLGAGLANSLAWQTDVDAAFAAIRDLHPALVAAGKANVVVESLAGHLVLWNPGAGVALRKIKSAARRDPAWAVALLEGLTAAAEPYRLFATRDLADELVALALGAPDPGVRRAAGILWGRHVVLDADSAVATAADPRVEASMLEELIVRFRGGDEFDDLKPPRAERVRVVCAVIARSDLESSALAALAEAEHHDLHECREVIRRVVANASAPPAVRERAKATLDTLDRRAPR